MQDIKISSVLVHLADMTSSYPLTENSTKLGNSQKKAEVSL
jgi:hypothetical protein